MFAILRTKRIKNNNSFGKALSHNLRTKYQNNIDKTKSHLNEILVDELDFNNANNENAYSDILENYYQKIEAKQKANSVKAMEFMLSASPEFFKQASEKQIQEWKKEQLEFAKKEFGDNLKFAVLHLDEKSPHIHLIVSVEEKKTVKFKNRYGSGEKEQISLNARRFNRLYLQNLQTRYAEHNKKFGLVRGLRNSKAIHTTLKDFYSSVNSAMSKDYDKVARKIISKILVDKQNLIGYIKASDIPDLLSPILDKLFQDNKKVKTLLNFNTEENIKEFEKILADKKNVESLRNEYFESVKNHSSLKKENEELKQKVNEYKQKEEKQAQKQSFVKLDKNIKKM